MRRDLRPAILGVFISMLGVGGCLGIAGDFGITGGLDATTSTADGGEASSDAVGDVGMRDVRQQDALPPADAADGFMQDVIEETSPPCVDGGECILAPCLNAQITCVGGVAVCQETGFVTNGTPCSATTDGGEVSIDAGVTAVCYQGACNSCNAGADCTSAGSCQKMTYDCSSGLAVCEDAGHEPDNTPCGTQRYCYGGVCSDCTVDASCVPLDAGCQQGVVTSCANGNATCTSTGRNQPNGFSCGVNAVCNGGACVGCSTNLVCTPSTNQCHTGLTSCASGMQICNDQGTAQQNFTACDGGNRCFGTYTCQSGTCTGSNAVICAKMDQCHVAGACDPTSGACSNPNAPSGTSCDDSNACTRLDQCENGSCVGTNPVTCTASDQCHDAGTCNTSTGACSNPVAPDGIACTDGNACTIGDNCQAGLCMPGAEMMCQPPADVCHLQGTCDPTTGACSNPAAPNGTMCSDGNACTVGDACDAGVCVPGMTMGCAPPADGCHLQGACDPTSGMCTTPTQPDGTGCSSGNLCVTGESCEGGVCGNGVPSAAAALCATTQMTCQPDSGTCL